MHEEEAGIQGELLLRFSIIIECVADPPLLVATVTLTHPTFTSDFYLQTLHGTIGQEAGFQP